MKVCPRCGSRISSDAVKCPVCEEISESDRKAYKRTSFYLYYISLIITVIYTAVYTVQSIINLSQLNTRMSRSESSYLGMVKKSPAAIGFYSLSFDLFLTAAFIVFVAVIIIKGRSKLLLMLPIAGITAEIAQLVKEGVNYAYIIRTKLSYLYGIVAMDFFVAFLVTLFFVFMMLIILKDLSLSACRLLVVFGFVLFISRVILKICMADDPEMLGFVSDTKPYIMLAALMIDVRKRYTFSRQL